MPLDLNQLCRPALAFLILAVLVCCACAMAGRASDNADAIQRSIEEETR